MKHAERYKDTNINGRPACAVEDGEPNVPKTIQTGARRLWCVYTLFSFNELYAILIS